MYTKSIEGFSLISMNSSDESELQTDGWVTLVVVSVLGQSPTVCLLYSKSVF